MVVHNPTTTPLMIRRFSYPLLLLLGGALTALATSQEIISRHLDATAGGKLVVDVDFGTVEVTGSGTDSKSVTIKAQRIVEIMDKVREKEFVAAAPITITQENNVITVRARSDREWTWNDDHKRMEARYTVQVPNNFTADLHTGGGAINVTDLTGKVQANTAGGRLNFNRVHGSTDGKTSGGAVSLIDCDGALKIETAGGKIIARGGKGTLDAETAGGHMAIRNFAGQVDIASNGGQLILNQITGPITAKTGGGQINATLSTATDVKLETNAGAISVAIPSNAGFDVDAQSGIGGVSTDLPVSGDRNSRQALIGALNGGGKKLFLRTGAGHISINSASGERASR